MGSFKKLINKLINKLGLEFSLLSNVTGTPEIIVKWVPGRLLLSKAQVELGMAAAGHGNNV